MRLEHDNPSKTLAQCLAHPGALARPGFSHWPYFSAEPPLIKTYDCSLLLSVLPNARQRREALGS